MLHVQATVVHTRGTLNGVKVDADAKQQCFQQEQQLLDA